MGLLRAAWAKPCRTRITSSSRSSASKTMPSSGCLEVFISQGGIDWESCHQGNSSSTLANSGTPPATHFRGAAAQFRSERAPAWLFFSSSQAIFLGSTVAGNFWRREEDALSLLGRGLVATKFLRRPARERGLLFAAKH